MLRDYRAALGCLRGKCSGPGMCVMNNIKTNYTLHIVLNFTHSLLVV